VAKLLGGIGSGKTAVSDIFKSLGVTVVDADVAQRTVVKLGQPALEKIAEHFGRNILLEDGNLNRPALRKIVFSSPEERGWLEKLLHPLIFHHLQKELAAADSEYALLVSPLLIETGQARLTQRILVVDASDEVRIKRTVERDGNDEAQVRAIMAAQADRETRLSRADDVINNEKDVDHLKIEVEKLHQLYLKLSREDEDIDD
jgi:dephospho-CoA kinase